MQIQILIKNNKNTILPTLDSIKPLKSKIIIGNLGSTDGTDIICRNLGLKIIPVSPDNYSQARNQLAHQKDWNFYINPGEIFLSGELFNPKQNCLVNILENGVLNKEIRIWKDSQFENPIYEAIYGSGELSDWIIRVDKVYEYPVGLLDKWVANNRISSRPIYYQAIAALRTADYDSFIKYTNLFLFKNKETDEVVLLLKYYLALIYTHKLELYQDAIGYILECLMIKPEYSEFWCLLGDIYYKNQQYAKAGSFYQNALIVGSKRLNSDLFPMEIKKYEQYPRKMLAACSLDNM